MGISVGRGAQVTTRATGQVNRLRRLLNVLKNLLAKIKGLLRKYKPLLYESRGAIGKCEARGFTGSTGPGKIPGHLNNAGKIVDAGMIGQNQSAEQTRDDLDF